MGHVDFYSISVIEFKNGDDDAIERIWRRMYPLIVKQIKGILPGLSFSDVLFEELLANCRIKVWRCMQLFNSERNKNFLTYAMVAVRNGISDVLRFEMPERVNRFAINAFDNDEEFADNIIYKHLDNTIAWIWVSATDARLLRREIINTIARELTGRSFVIFLLKRVGKTDDEIRRKFNFTVKDYQRVLRLLQWRMSYIIKKYQFELL